MAKNYIVTDKGVPMNLDWLTKILSAAGFATPAPKRNVYFHGIAGGGTNSGSTTAHDYLTALIALASYARVTKTILALQNNQDVNPDLRIPQTVINTPDAFNSLVGTASVDSEVVLNGKGFSINSPVVTLYDHATPYVTAITTSVSNNITYEQAKFTCNVPAATYDIVYTDGDGGWAILENKLTIS